MRRRSTSAAVNSTANTSPATPAAHGAGRTVIGRDLPLGQVRQLARQELLLDERGDPHLLLEPLPGLDLDGLLADQLRNPNRRRRLGGQGREEPAVVGAVVLVREPGPEVEGADELALGDERDDDPDAGRAELLECGRLEIEPLDLDHAAGGLEVGEERVVRRDLDRGTSHGRDHGRGRDVHRHRGGARTALVSSGRGPSSNRALDRIDECHGAVLRLHRPETVTS